MNNNTNKNSTGIIVGILIVVIIIIVIILSSAKKSENMDNVPAAEAGTVYIGITDATADIKNVDEINMEVTKVELHSATRGWTTISMETEDYDLLELKSENKTELYAQKDVAAGQYDRVRVTIGDTMVKTKTKGTVEAHSPSQQVVMNMGVNVNAQKATHVELDVLADQSLHLTTDGKYVFTPVIKAESTSDATVTITDDEITTAGGTLDSSVSVGMDLDGSSKTNFILQTSSDAKSSINLDVTSSANGAIQFMLGDTTFNGSTVDQESALNANSKTNTSTNTSTNTTTNGGSTNANTGTDADADTDNDADLTNGVKTNVGQ